MARIAKPEGMGEDAARRLRIKGISADYDGLLGAAGVRSTAGLARRNPHNLLQKLVDANASLKLVLKTPTLPQVTDWIKQAQVLSQPAAAPEKRNRKRRITGIRDLYNDRTDLDETESLGDLPGGGGTDNLP